MSPEPSRTFPVHILAGPTASGKSARALEIARAENGVVINADSLQLYDALPILTARPDPEETVQVPHRLYGALPPSESCSAAQWREMAMAEIAAAHEAGKLPIVCGGTGFYIEALREGFSPIPDIPPEIRAYAIALQKEVGNPAFHALLAARDPESAARLLPQDTQRLVRAFEVMEHTGKPLSWWQAQPRQGPPENWRFTLEILMPERAELHRRCARRLEAMMEAGAVQEVAAFDEKLRAGAYPQDCPPTRALGFQPLRAFVRGEIARAQAFDLALFETRQYAKRQCTWLRGRALQRPLTRFE